MKAVRVHEYGSEEVLVYEEVATPSPGPGQVRIRTEFAGVNFTDVYWRRGFYRAPLPYVPGVEGVGLVEVVGEGVEDVAVGARVAFAQQTAAYAECVVVDRERLVRVPEAVGAAEAVSLMLQGLTAHYLASDTYPVGPGTTALVLAAAGGVGRLLVQIVKLRGGMVIAGTSSLDKAALAVEAGADEVIIYDENDIEEAVRCITGGRGANVVYDGVGLRTWEKSLTSVAQRGTLVLYGQSSGPVPPFDTLRLAERSIFLARPRLRPHIASQEALDRRAAELFGWFAARDLVNRLDRVFALEEAASAHRYLASGRTTGKVLLQPVPAGGRTS